MKIGRGGLGKSTTLLAVALSCVALSSIGGADSIEKARNIADQELFFAPVPKAVCGPGDKPETALQGQVPAAMRAAGFQGFSCNLQLLGQVRDEGANWQTAEWREGKGANKKVCAYHGTANPGYNPTLPRIHNGVRVIDVSDPTKPVTTAYLTSAAMIDPWESLKTNQRRKLLGAVNGGSSGAGAPGGGPEIDIYDVSGDCRFPQLLTSTALPSPDVIPIVGHEGSWAPDGMTYYASDLRYSPATSIPGNLGRYYAVDTTDTIHPKFIMQWQTAVPGGRPHGLSISEDGTRGYFASLSTLSDQALVDDSASATDGLLIYDLSDVQARRANPNVKLVGSVFWKDGAVAQHTINIKIKGKPYVVFADEAGAGGLPANSPSQVACNAGLAPFAMARIIDIGDETHPKVISKLMLETHDTANCDKVRPDLVGLTAFTYGSHYCSVDNINRATTLACGYQNSGIRVFDIRDPIRPREIAYYNPPANSALLGGSNHAPQRVTQPGGPDWCAAQLHLDAERGTIWSTCQDNGLLSLKFTHNAWPFAESTTPAGMQN